MLVLWFVFWGQNIREGIRPFKFLSTIDRNILSWFLLLLEDLSFHSFGFWSWSMMKSAKDLKTCD